MRVLRALPPPWVRLQREWRPSSDVRLRAAGDRGRKEAAACFGLGHPPTETALITRPGIAGLLNPGRHKRSHDSRFLALGYGVKLLRSKVLRCLTHLKVALSN